jgi:hypothetical protein
LNLLQVQQIEAEAKLLKIQEHLQKELSKSRLFSSSLEHELERLTVERDIVRPKKISQKSALF